MMIMMIMIMIITVPQKGYAKRGSKKGLLLSDLKVICW